MNSPTLSTPSSKPRPRRAWHDALESAPDELTPLLQRWCKEPGGLLPLLHDIQALYGYIAPAWVPRIARALGLSRAEVHGVISFYHDFRTQPPARQRLQVCQAESCQAMGSRELTAALEQRLGCTLDTARSDGAWALESVYCLGLCAASPAMRLGERVFARVTPQQALALVDQAEEQRP